MKFKVRYISVSKFFFIAYLLYEQVFRYLLFSSQVLSYTLIGLALLLQIMHERRIRIENNVLSLSIFGLVSLISSMLVARDRDIAFSFLIMYFVLEIIVYLIIRYSECDNSISFSSMTFVGLSIIMAIITLLYGRGLYRLSFSDNLNENTIGVIMMFGIGYNLFLFIRKIKSPKNIILFVITTLLMLYILMRTVSKKAIIGVAVLLVLWVLICYRRSFIKLNPFLRFFIFISLIGVGYYAYMWFVSSQASTVSYMLYRFDRLNLDDNGSTEVRFKLIIDGFHLFLEHPIVGVGYNNFRYYNQYGLYSHCFYIELLACTGVLGSIFFLFPIVKATKTLCKKTAVLQTEDDNFDRLENKYIIVVLVVLMALSITQIIFYELPLMYVLGTIIGYSDCKNKKMKLSYS